MLYGDIMDNKCGRYAYLCINAMVALAREKIKTREELDKAMKFFRRFINEDL